MLPVQLACCQSLPALTLSSFAFFHLLCVLASHFAASSKAAAALNALSPLFSRSSRRAPPPAASRRRLLHSSPVAAGLHSAMSRSRTKTLWLQNAPEETLPGVYNNITSSIEEDDDVVYAETSPPTSVNRTPTWYGDGASGALHINPVYISSRDHTSSSFQDYEVASADATGEVTNAYTMSAPTSRKHDRGRRTWSSWQEYLPLLISLVAVILAGAALAMVSSPSSSDPAPDAAASTDVLGSRIATLEAQCVSWSPRVTRLTAASRIPINHHLLG